MTAPRTDPQRGKLPDEAVADMLRAEFAREIEVQCSRVPGAALIRLLAEVEERNRRRSAVALLESWPQILVPATVAALLVFWREDASGALDALLPLSIWGFSWTAGLGICAGLFTLLALWPSHLIRED